MFRSKRVRKTSRDIGTQGRGNLARASLHVVDPAFYSCDTCIDSNRVPDRTCVAKALVHTRSYLICVFAPRAKACFAEVARWISELCYDIDRPANCARPKKKCRGTANRLYAINDPAIDRPRGDRVVLDRDAIKKLRDVGSTKASKRDRSSRAGGAMRPIRRARS